MFRILIVEDLDVILIFLEHLRLWNKSKNLEGVYERQAAVRGLSTVGFWDLAHFHGRFG